MTPHSVRRPNGFCLNEIAAAVGKIPIIPLMVSWCEPPLSIARIQWLDMRDCVPVAEQSERYQQKFDRLVQALEEDKLDFEASQSSLVQLLKPLDFSADIAEHVPRFVGRQWLFDRIDFWLANPAAARIFWLVGGPGVGKTAIAAYLCHKHREVAAFHFCRHHHDDKSDPRRCITSLAYQLASQLPSYQQRLLAMDLQAESRKSADTVFDNLIVQPLAPPFPVPDRTILIVIDALDEATLGGNNDLAEFLARGFRRTPSWLRLLVTSRPEAAVMQPLQGLSACALTTDSPENKRDLSTYIERMLHSVSVDPGSEMVVIDTLLQKSEGVFLYIDKIFVELREGSLTLDRMDTFPQGMGEWFIGYFKRQFPDLDGYVNKCRPLLEMIIAANGPLPLKLARDGFQRDDYSFQASVASLGSLFPLRGGNIQPFHQSVIDWLSDPERAGSYFISLSQGRKHLADVCWTDYRADAAAMSRYTMDHLPTHLVEQNRWEELLELVTNPQLGLIAKWLEEGGGNNSLSYLVGLIDYLHSTSNRSVMSAGLATQIARIHSVRGQYDDAQKWLRYALKKASWFHGRRAMAVALHEMASLRLYQNEFFRASCLYRWARWICRCGIPVFHDEAAANLIGLAAVFKVRGLNIRTVHLASRALLEARKAGDIRHEVASERLLGAACKSLGRWDEADTHLKHAMMLSDLYGIPIEKARLLLLQGWLEYERAMFRKELPIAARVLFLEGTRMAQQVHEHYSHLEAQMSLAWCALAGGATDEAEGCFKSLKNNLQEVSHVTLISEINLGLSVVAHQKGKLKDAEKLYEEVTRFAELHGLPWQNCLALVGLGAVCWHQNKISQAKEMWQRASRVANRISRRRRDLIAINIESCKLSALAGPRSVILR